jgi:hypothetical protein
VRETKSESNGEYRFDLLDAGEYTIRVTAAGFKALEDSAIQLHVAQSSQFDVPLAVGAVSEQVVIAAGVSTLETGVADFHERLHRCDRRGAQVRRP